jgi:hypothetical protein
MAVGNRRDQNHARQGRALRPTLDGPAPPWEKAAAAVNCGKAPGPNVKLLLATPVATESVTIPYMNSVISLLAHMGRQGVQIHRHYIVNSLISRARNAFASLVLNDESYSHLLFIDSDIGFRAEAVSRMLAFDQPVVGCIYPARRMDQARYHAITRQIDDPETAASAALNYVGEGWAVEESREGRTGIALKDGFVRVSRIAGGMTLIRREVIEAVAGRYPELVATPDPDYEAYGVRDRVLQCFEQMPGPNGLYLSEDISFALRWTEGCGGQIWACVDETLTHWGTMGYTGRYLDRLRLSGGPG